MDYRVFNATDGVYASPDVFDTAGAEEFCSQFRRKFKMIQGYYKTADGERIDPADVKLVLEAKP